MKKHLARPESGGKSENFGTGPIQPEYFDKMNELARFLDHEFNGDERPKKVGFVFMVFPMNSTDGRCNYISNAQRKDIVVLLKEQIARFEGRMTDEEGKA